MKYPCTYIQNDPESKGLSDFIPDIVFSTVDGQDIKLSLILPRLGEGQTERKRYPTLIFLQGSGWTAPQIRYQVPQMAAIAAQGWAVCMITHRNANDGFKAPAFLIDTKCAIRYLRAHAQEYGLDKERFVFWGTSSGGNAALLVGLTGDAMQYKTEYAEESDSVLGVIDCFGPTDLLQLQNGRNNKALTDRLTPTDHPDRDGLLREISPLCLVDNKKNLPPMLILHGDADPVVPLEQSVLMYEALRDRGHDAEMVIVKGAPHEGSFWSKELFAICQSFMDKVIGKK